jgi:hypothetical protein
MQAMSPRKQKCVILGFSRSVNKFFALMAFYAALVDSYRRCGTTYRSHIQGSNSPKEFLACPLNMRPVGYPAILVTKYEYQYDP